MTHSQQKYSRRSSCPAAAAAARRGLMLSYAYTYVAMTKAGAKDSGSSMAKQQSSTRHWGSKGGGSEQTTCWPDVCGGNKYVNGIICVCVTGTYVCVHVCGACWSQVNWIYLNFSLLLRRVTPSQFFISAACSCLKCSLGATLWNILRNLPLVFNTLQPLLLHILLLLLPFVCCCCFSYNVRCWKAAREESKLYEHFLFIYIEIKLRLAVEIVAVALPRCCHVNPCNIFLSIPCTMESTTLGSTFQLQPQLAAQPAGR